MLRLGISARGSDRREDRAWWVRVKGISGNQKDSERANPEREGSGVRSTGVVFNSKRPLVGRARVDHLCAKLVAVVRGSGGGDPGQGEKQDRHQLLAERVMLLTQCASDVSPCGVCILSGSFVCERCGSETATLRQPAPGQQPSQGMVRTSGFRADDLPAGSIQSPMHPLALDLTFKQEHNPQAQCLHADYVLADGRGSPFFAVAPPASTRRTRVTHPVQGRIYDVSRPPIGSKNTQGRRPRMEDTDTELHNLVEGVPLVVCDPPRKVVPPALERGLGPLLDDVPGDLDSPRTTLARFASDDSEEGLRSATPKPGGGPPRVVMSNFHFAAVYDGHGGQHVSRRIGERLHSHVRDVLLAAACGRAIAAQAEMEVDDEELSSASTQSAVGPAQGHKFHSAPRDSSNASSVTVENLCSTLEASGGWPAFRDGKPPLNRARRNGPTADSGSSVTVEAIAGVLASAFRRMDEELVAEDEARHVGSTAVVTLVCGTYIFVANCGDSRAVLCRAGSPYRLSRDHKPELRDERERIQRLGGKILDFNGTRVMGLLAMTRAFGDHVLRDVGVIPDPEITAINRTPEDQFLILASDGLWDVLGDGEACNLTHRCFQRAKERGAGPETAPRVAASVLLRAALDRGSADNITVVVVDLRPEVQMQF